MIIEGNLIDINKKKIYPATITVNNQKIVSIQSNSNTYNTYILPGFIDSHIHVESSMMLPSEFIKMQLKHGVIGCIADPHEIANVMGIDGILYIIENSRDLPFYCNYAIPSCVPATPFETSGGKIGVKELKQLLQLDEIKALGEVMNIPAVLNKDPKITKMIELTLSAGKIVDGHAPGLSGENLKKYIQSGITTDHECTTINEAKEKISLGMKIAIREGSAAKDFEVLSELIVDNYKNCMFCTDDKHPDDLQKGSINTLVNRALKKKYNIFSILNTASKVAKEHYLLDCGLLRPGDNADFIITNNLNIDQIIDVYIKGNRVVNKGKISLQTPKPVIINNFHVNNRKKEEFSIPAKSTKVKVIQTIDGSLITKKVIRSLPDDGKSLLCDTSQDIVKIAVINRYKESPPALGFITGTGLKKGALASSVAHDSHNIVAIGDNDEDICAVINAIIENKGGIALKSNTNLHILPLPIAGIISDKKGNKVANEYTKLNQKAQKKCTKLSAPFMTLSFMALLVIPEIKIGDKGLFDGGNFEFIELYENKEICLPNQP